MKMLFVTAALLFAVPGLAQGDDAKRAAEIYLNALTGTGDQAGKDLLLGGVTMNAQLFSLENWELKAKDPVKREEADVAHAVGMVSDLDQTGRRALTKLMGAQGVGDDLKMVEVSKEEAEKLLAPTREKAAALLKAHPLLAYVLRVGNEVYWHPKNPMRSLLAKAGTSGKYSLEFHRWTVVSREGPTKRAREWPLRVLRFKSAKVDTGWKVLPASDWNAE